jgi:uncharacterized phage-like protein YoqJ
MTSTTNTKTSEQALYIYVDDNLRDGLKALKDDSGLSYRKLTRRMIEETYANELLEEAIRSYFLDHSSSWSDSNQIKKIRVCQDSDTLALASALAFRICGTGSISEVCRLMIRYYVDHSLVEGLMSTLQEEPKKLRAAAQKMAPAVVSVPFVPTTVLKDLRVKRIEENPDDENKYVTTSFNLDIETVDLLAELVKTMRVKYLALTSQLIEQYLADDARYKLLSESDVLLEDPPMSKTIVVKRFNFTPEADALLEYLCEKVLADDNKSAMIRALIKVEAELQGLRQTPQQSKRGRRRVHATPRRRTNTKRRTAQSAK